MHEYMTHDQFVNHDGTTDHITDGELVGTAVKSVSGETDHYDNEHNLDLRSSDNPEGGTNYSDSDGSLVVKTIPNHDGGDTVYTAGMKVVADTIPHPGGGEYVVGPDSALIASTQPLGHGFVDVMHHSDPLVHTNEFQIPQLDLDS
jgi:hypothetical protein